PMLSPAISSPPSEPLMAGLKAARRPVQGRCAACAHLDICGGNTRVRAQQVTGNPWAEDPGCYLDDYEIGGAGGARVAPKPFAARRRVPVVAAE
ncbi:MAG TPA: heme d1 biosynthesis radical SAM protein NirJ, partial [Rubrivivax sp.]|nr:heme d1 biosynthesis radical SAM protein NirJ [Rubrivivax sp.]